MPTKVFLNLPSHKKDKLIEGAFIAFSNTPYKDITVKDITKTLGITRTAFYYYFTDKLDIYNYITLSIKEEFVDDCVYKREDKIDLFELVILLFDYLSKFKNTTKMNYFIDLFNNIGYNSQTTLLSQLLTHNVHEEFRKFKGFNDYKMKNEEQVNDILRVVFSMTFHKLLNYYTHEINIEKSRSDLIDELNFIKYGIIEENK